MMKTGAHIALCFELKKSLPQSESYEESRRKLYVCE